MRSASTARPSPLLLGPWQYFYLAAALLLLVPLLAVAPFHREIDEWHARAVWGPQLERTLGFRMASGPHPAFPEVRGDIDYIAFVEPGGPFARAGFHVGDVPDRRCSICTPSLYTQLEWNRGGAAEIAVFRRPIGPLTRPDLLTLEVRVPKDDVFGAER